MVAVAVRAEQHVGFLYLLFALRTERIIPPGIDIDGCTVAGFNAEGSVAQPRQPVSLQIHCSLSRSKIEVQQPNWSEETVIGFLVRASRGIRRLAITHYGSPFSSNSGLPAPSGFLRRNTTPACGPC